MIKPTFKMREDGTVKALAPNGETIIMNEQEFRRMFGDEAYNDLKWQTWMGK